MQIRTSYFKLTFTFVSAQLIKLSSLALCTSNSVRPVSHIAHMKLVSCVYDGVMSLVLIGNVYVKCIYSMYMLDLDNINVLTASKNRKPFYFGTIQIFINPLRFVE